MSYKVSIIVPIYNHGRFLEERLDSIFKQSYKNFDVIVLDDCSSDKSLKIIEQYKTQKEFTFVKNKTNSNSPFSQWKKGLELCNGDYVWIAESDDSSDEKFLESLIKVFEKHPSRNVSTCNGPLVQR